MRWCLLYVSCHPDGAFSIDRHFVRRHGGKAGEDVRIGWLWEKGAEAVGGRNAGGLQMAGRWPATHLLSKVLMTLEPTGVE